MMHIADDRIEESLDLGQNRVAAADQSLRSGPWRSRQDIIRNDCINIRIFWSSTPPKGSRTAGHYKI
jgi:hypothetical protein